VGRLLWNYLFTGIILDFHQDNSGIYTLALGTYGLADFYLVSSKDSLYWPRDGEDVFTNAC